MRKEITYPDNKIISFSDLAKILLSLGKIRSAFINYINSELLIITRDNFKQESLNELREQLPIWIEGQYHPKDPLIIYSCSCILIRRIKVVTLDLGNSPLRLKLQYPELEKLL